MRVRPGRHWNSSLNPGMSAAGSSRLRSDREWAAVVDGLGADVVGSAADIDAEGEDGVASIVSVAALVASVGALLADSDAADLIDDPPEPAWSAQPATVSATVRVRPARTARVGRGRADLGRGAGVDMGFLAVVGCAPQRRVGDSDSAAPAVACPDTVSGVG